MSAFCHIYVNFFVQPLQKKAQTSWLEGELSQLPVNPSSSLKNWRVVCTWMRFLQDLGVLLNWPKATPRLAVLSYPGTTWNIWAVALLEIASGLLPSQAHGTSPMGPVAPLLKSPGTITCPICRDQGDGELFEVLLCFLFHILSKSARCCVSIV